MTDAEQMAEELDGHLLKIKVGTLRFWGEWFGKPHDNLHRLIACEAKADLLRLRFDEDELLSVWSPKILLVGESIFRISDAAKVRWEWFYYGRSKTPANFYFMEFTKEKTEVHATTDVDWYVPVLKPKTDFPAVEIL